MKNLLYLLLILHSFASILGLADPVYTDAEFVDAQKMAELYKTTTFCKKI